MAKKQAKKKKKKKKKTNALRRRGQSSNPDHSDLLPKLNRTEGQIAGIKKMIEELRYCPDIIQQVRAARKSLFGIEAALLEAHLEECVSDVMARGSAVEQETIIKEIMRTFKSADSHGIEF